MIALILCYKRLNLVRRLLTRIVSLNHFSEVFIVQDGLRYDENSMGKSAYLELQHELKTLSAEFGVHPIQYESNVGLTEHVFRVYEDLSLQPSSVVLFEEDKLPTIGGINFLHTSRESMKSTDLLDTYTRTEGHLFQFSSLSTLFSLGGNHVWGDDLFTYSRSVWERKKLDVETFENNLRSYFALVLDTRFEVNRAISYYVPSILSRSLSPDQGDSLLFYSLVMLKGWKKVPLSAQVEDVTGESDLGLNRNKPYSLDCFCPGVELRIGDVSLCKLCERNGISSRVGLSLGDMLLRSGRFRIKKLWSKTL